MVKQASTVMVRKGVFAMVFDKLVWLHQSRSNIEMVSEMN